MTASPCAHLCGGRASNVVGLFGQSVGRFRLTRIALKYGTTESDILKRVVDPLAAARWVLAIGAHDTDYVMVREDQLQTAVSALRAAATW